MRHVKVLEGGEGLDFIRCRICGDRRRVISRRHLSKHDMDRGAYMAEYGLSADELIAAGFRVLNSSREGYRPFSKRDWIAALKRVYEMDQQVSSGYIQDNYPSVYNQGAWLFGNWDEALIAAGFDPNTTRLRKTWDRDKVTREIQQMLARNQRLNARYVMENNKSMFAAALRQFGSWNEALAAAGVYLPNKKTVTE